MAADAGRRRPRAWLVLAAIVVAIAVALSAVAWCGGARLSVHQEGVGCERDTLRDPGNGLKLR